MIAVGDWLCSSSLVDGFSFCELGCGDTTLRMHVGCLLPAQGCICLLAAASRKASFLRPSGPLREICLIIFCFFSCLFCCCTARYRIHRTFDYIGCLFCLQALLLRPQLLVDELQPRLRYSVLMWGLAIASRTPPAMLLAIACGDSKRVRFGLQNLP